MKIYNQTCKSGFEAARMIVLLLFLIFMEIAWSYDIYYRCTHPRIIGPSPIELQWGEEINIFLEWAQNK